MQSNPTDSDFDAIHVRVLLPFELQEQMAAAASRSVSCLSAVHLQYSKTYRWRAGEARLG